MLNALKSAAQRIKTEGRQSVMNPRTNFLVGASSLVDNSTKRNAYSREQQTEVSRRKDDRSIIIGGRSTSLKPLHTSYNAWPYAGARDSSHRRSRDSKPMTNQKARALVQQDYFFQRQGNSQQQLVIKDDVSNFVGTVLSTDIITQNNNRNNNPTYSYEAFLN